MGKLRYRLRVPTGNWLQNRSVSFRFPSRNAIRKLSMTTGIDREHYDSDSLYASHKSPITCFTEDETMTRDVVRSWANSELKPLVRQMDDEECINPEILQQLFDNGFMAMVSFVDIYLLNCPMFHTLVNFFHAYPWLLD